MSKHLTYLYPSPGSAGGLILWKGSSHGHKVLAQRRPSDCWVFHCIIAGSWPYNVKHVEVTAQYKLNWYVFANRDPPAKGFQRTQTSSHPVFKDSNCTLLRVDDAVHRLSADWLRKMPEQKRRGSRVGRRSVQTEVQTVAAMGTFNCY